MTGQYSHANGVRDNMGTKLNPNAPWMPDELRKSGYEVAFCGKSHVPGHFRDKTWDYYCGFTGQGNYFKPVLAETGPDGKIGPDKPYDGWIDDVVTDKAIAWMQRRQEGGKGEPAGGSPTKANKPFVLFLFFKSPHRAWQPAPRNKDLYADAVVKKPALWDDSGAGKPRAFLQAANMIGQYPDVKDYDGMIRDYCRCITGVDDNVGKVLKALDDAKIADDTAVMYTSDNGFFLGEWQRFDKRFMHEPSIRVPLLLKLPKAMQKAYRPAGTKLDPMVLNVDIAPTILEFAGAEVPKAMQGRSVLPSAHPATGHPPAGHEAAGRVVLRVFRVPGPITQRQQAPRHPHHEVEADPLLRPAVQVRTRVRVVRPCGRPGGAGEPREPPGDAADRERAASEDGRAAEGAGIDGCEVTAKRGLFNCVTHPTAVQ